LKVGWKARYLIWRVHSSRRRSGRIVVVDGSQLWVWDTFFIAEVRGLVHVDPETVDVDSAVCVEEASELFVPIVLSLRREPVWED
jgi:hypothetical protein